MADILTDAAAYAFGLDHYNNNNNVNLYGLDKEVHVIKYIFQGLVKISDPIKLHFSELRTNNQIDLFPMLHNPGIFWK